MKFSTQINPIQTVIFVHIPKAAGSTLKSIVTNQYKIDSLFLIDGDNPSNSIERFKNLSKHERQNTKCLFGHMPFGIHEYIPQSSTYATMIRNPIDRIISHYFFVRKTPSHYLYKRVIDQNISLDEYVSSGLSTELNNGQTRFLAGTRCEDYPHEKCPIEILEIAKKNLIDYFSYVGITEKFDESILLLKRVFGYQNVCYSLHNVNTNREPSNLIPESTKELIHQFNTLDVELYSFVQKIFNDQIEKIPNLERDLQTYRLYNKFYQSKESFKSSLKSLIKIRSF
jgi:hypothetical protein